MLVLWSSQGQEGKKVMSGHYFFCVQFLLNFNINL